MSVRYDLVVVGAGPAGAACARRASDLGLATLVLERATFPRAKPCAAGLSLRALAVLGDAVDSVVHDVVDTIRVDAGDMRLSWTAPGAILKTTRREELDALLAERAREAGARIEFGSRVVSLARWGDGFVVEARGERRLARHVVAADGAMSETRRLAGLPAPPLGGAMYVRAYPRSASELRRFRGSITFDVSAFRQGYGWIFPKADHLNVGVYGRAPLGENYRVALESFARSWGFDAWRTEGPFAHPIPTRVSGGCLGAPGVLVVGDAAGLVDPVTGEGSSHAMASGTAAAEAIAESVSDGGDASRIYEQRVLRELVPEVNVLRRVGGFFYALGPRGVERALGIPPLRWAAVRLGPWGKLGSTRGELRVEHATRRRH